MKKYKIGDLVKVKNPRLRTWNNEGEITKNDSHKYDYKVNFDESWCGYYNEKDLCKIKEEK